MRSVQTPGETRLLGLQQGFEGLSVRDEIITLHLANGQTAQFPCMVTTWRPSADDLANLQAGMPIRLTLMGNAHPPVRLEVVGAALESKLDEVTR